MNAKTSPNAQHTGERQATFTRFDECSKQDAEIILENYTQFAQEIPTRVLDHLRLLDGDFGGFNVDRLQFPTESVSDFAPVFANFGAAWEFASEPSNLFAGWYCS